MIPNRKRPTIWRPERPTPKERGVYVTICIAAMTQLGMADGQIIMAMDRLITAPDDLVPGAEVVLKARKVSMTWALMFAGNGDLFLPMQAAISKRLGDFNGVYSLATVQSAALEAYHAAFDDQFTGMHLSRYGFAGITEFRTLGWSQLGKKFKELCDLIDNFSIGIDLLFCGFGADRMPHIFEISNLGVVTSHDLLGHAAIGSGTYMATASMRRKPMPYHRDALIYRVLEAKFSAETAAGVGDKTVMFTLSSDGHGKSIGVNSIAKVKEIYENILKQSEPKEATDLIANLLR